MRDTSALYQQILEQPDHYKEVQVKIGTTVHPYLSCSVYGSLYEKASVGGTAARQIDLDIYPAGPVNDDDPIQIFVRLSSADGAQKSEWIPKGTFLIDTNPVDHDTGVMSIHGFDAMLKMEQPIIAKDAPSGQWPRAVDSIMEEIAERIGVELDSRTTLNPAYTIPLPLDPSSGENDSIYLSMRTIAGYIAAMHGGNWTITDENRLLLVPLAADITLLSDEDDVAILFGDTLILV